MRSHQSAEKKQRQKEKKRASKLHFLSQSLPDHAGEIPIEDMDLRGKFDNQRKTIKQKEINFHTQRAIIQLNKKGALKKKRGKNESSSSEKIHYTNN